MDIEFDKQKHFILMAIGGCFLFVVLLPYTSLLNIFLLSQIPIFFKDPLWDRWIKWLLYSLLDKKWPNRTILKTIPKYINSWKEHILDILAGELGLLFSFFILSLVLYNK